MKFFSSLFFSMVFFLLPKPVFAAVIIGTGDFTEKIGCRTGILSFEGVPTLGCLAGVIVNIVDFLYAFSLVAGIAFFIFGAVKFMLSDAEKGVKNGRDTMMWAVYGFIFILVSFLIIRFVLTLFGFPDLIDNFTLFIKKP